MRIVKLQKSASSSVCNFREIRCHCYRPCTHFDFFLPTEKFLRGQGEKYTRAEKGIDNYHLTEIYIAYSLSTNDLFTTRISDR